MTTFYVATTGNNSNDGLTPGTAKRDISAALSLVGFGSGAGAGDIVTVANGTYSENLGTIPTGTSGNVFTLKSTNSRGATIQPSASWNLSQGGNLYLRVEGFVFNFANNNSGNSINISVGTNDITFYDTEFKNTPMGGGTGPNSWQACYYQGDRVSFISCSMHDIGAGGNGYNHGLYNGGGDYSLIDGCTIYNINGNGIQFYSEHPEQPDNGTIRNCRIYNFALGGYDSGIYCSTGTGNVVYNNIIYNTTMSSVTRGITVRGTNNRFYNNTIYNNNIGFEINGSNCVVINNISYGNSVDISGSASTMSNNLTTNPFFVNAASGDFHLTAQSTNAIDKGVIIN